MKQIIFLSAACNTAPHHFMSATWLAHQGWPLLCITDGQPNETEYSTPLGKFPIEVVTAGGRIGKQVGYLLKLLKHRFTGPKKIFLVQGSPVCPAAWVGLLGVPRQRVIYETLDFLEPGRYPFWEFFERRFARRAGNVLSNDPCRARFIGSHYRLRKLVVVERTALPTAWPTPERDESLRAQILAKVGRSNDSNARLIITGGSFSAVRLGMELLQALALLPENYIMVFSGTKPGSAQEQKTNEAIRAAGVEHRAVILGFLEFDELLRQYAAGDIGILLYPNDGVGNFFQAPGRLTQYVGCGLPFVASNFPGLELLTLKHHLGATCDPTAPAAIAAAIRSIGDQSNEALAAWRTQLRQVAKHELSYDELAVRIEQVVTEAAQHD